jgi:hypothetical protein
LHTITELGFNQRSYVELASLVRILDSPLAKYPGMVDYKSIVRHLKTRPFSWWQEKLQNNSFEGRNLLNKDGSFTRILSIKEPNYIKFQLSVIAEKLLSGSKRF